MNRRILVVVAGLIAILGSFRAARTESAPASENTPKYTSDGQLIRPKNYREWIYLTSGLGMSYSGLASSKDAPVFDNVFVAPASYREFLKTGKWPDKTMFALEIRASSSHGSINKDGHFQSGLNAIEVEVKDESRFKEKWAFFGFDEGDHPKETAEAFPKSDCFSCHNPNGAVDNTFVQFYPTLLEVARAKGTLNPNFHDETAGQAGR